MSVVGFDIGYQSSYIAVARQGGVETATNDYSQRATPSCVSFGSKSRCMGVAARQQVATNLKNTVFSFKHLIGRKFNDPVVQAERKLLPYELVELPENHIGIKVAYLNETRVFTPEQILAILLTKLRELAESYLKTKVSDCVISIPCYWTDTQRRALLDAAKIVDLNCLRIINDTTSTALAYGIYKQDLPDENEKSRLILFVDMGHSGTQLSLCAFNKGKLKMVGTVWDLNLGGRDFDGVLYEYFNQEFKKTYRVDADTSARAKFRLFDEVEKVKKQMSANPNPIPLSIECFLNDKDVSAVIKRIDFENMSKNLWARFTTLLHKLLTETKTKPSDVHVIEMVGGGSRMPMMRQIVQEIFNKEPCTTLNQDEAVSRGCALQCAILSPTFRVREFNITDVQPFAIKLNWKAVTGADEGEMEVFGEHHPYPFSKMLTFYRKEPFVLEASYAYPNHIPYYSKDIGKFLISNVVPTSCGDSSKIKVKVRINGNGVFAVTSASLYENVQKSEEDEAQQEDGEKMEAQSINSGDANQRTWAEPDSIPKPGGERTGENDAESSAEPTEHQAENGESDSNKAGGQTADRNIPTVSPPKPAKVKVKSVDLPIKECVAQMTDDDIKKFRSMELELQKQDRIEKEKADAKNALEEYVYEIRDKLSDKMAEFVTPQDKDRFIGQLEATETWLYEDGDDQPKEIYVERLNALQNVGAPICERYAEAQERPTAFQSFGHSLQMARKFYDQYMAKDPKYDHVEAADAEKVRKAIDEKQVWLEKSINAQGRRPLTDPPVVLASQIYSEKDAFDRIVLPIVNKPKPKVDLPPEPKPQSETNPKPPNATKTTQEANMEVE